MSKRMSPRDARLYRLCDEALHYLWDPIGVAWAPQARSEYSGYVPEVFELVRADQRAQLVAYLGDVVVDRMGLRTTPRRKRERIADFLIEARDWLDEISVDESTQSDNREH